VVRTLAEDINLPRYTFFEFNWDGKDGRGRLAPQGRYKLQVTLHDRDQVLTTRGRLFLHSVPPRRSCGGDRSNGG
jgi:hypothetical protein